MKKLFLLLSVGMLSIPCFSTNVIYTRNTSGAGPNGYSSVTHKEVTVGNVTVGDIICRNPGSTSCPPIPTGVFQSISVDGVSLDAVEYIYLKQVLGHVDQNIAVGNSTGTHTIHFYDNSSGTDYYYTANWSLDENGNQKTTIIKI